MALQTTEKSFTRSFNLFGILPKHKGYASILESFYFKLINFLRYEHTKNCCFHCNADFNKISFLVR